MTRYVFVTGGVVSSLGKGITSASLGALLKARGLTVVNQKFDPYINIDPDTMNPFQHGEVFVTEDGATTDLDLGHYERFTGVDLKKESNVTTGSIYRAVIDKERRGAYLGATVQVVPHITNEIKKRIKSVSNNHDVQITEIGGTVGDIEILPFLEAARLLRKELGRENVIFIHVTLVPYIGPSSELKSKPTQHSVAQLRGYGITPDLIVLRSNTPITDEVRNKVSLFCDVSIENVVSAEDLNDIYEIPLRMHKEGLDKSVVQLLNLESKEIDLSEWENIHTIQNSITEKVNIGILGKYNGLPDSYLSVIESLKHACIHNKVGLEIKWINSDNFEFDEFENLDGVVVPGGFGQRGIEGKVKGISYLRENKIPFLGLCLGLQCAVIEFARNVCGIEDADSSEFSPTTKNPVIDLLPNQNIRNDDIGGTMRLGTYPTKIIKNTKAMDIYAEEIIYERHRHRYEVNNKYRDQLERNGLVFSGMSPDNDLIEIIEVKNHPFFMGTQFHPEFKSRPSKPSPIFKEFIKSAKSLSVKNIKSSNAVTFDSVD